MAFDNNEQTIHGVGRETTDITITHIGYFKLEYICLIRIIFLLPSPIQNGRLSVWLFGFLPPDSQDHES